MKRVAIGCLLAVLVVVGFAFTGRARGQDGASGVDVEALMQQKLQSAQSLIKGLALNDFELIKREAQRLQLLSLDAGWNTVQTKEYARISGEFREAAAKIRAAGEKENLDAAALGYVQLTMTCIDCHRHVRDVTDGR